MIAAALLETARSTRLEDELSRRGIKLRGGPCSCKPDITVKLPDGRVVSIDGAGRVRKETRQ
jgi:hypothetical protein